MGYCIGTERNHRDVGSRRVFSEDSQRFDTADTRQIDVHQDDIRPRGARNLDAAVAVPRSQQADIGPARDEILDQHQIGGVVLDIEQGARLGVGMNLRPGDSRGFGCAGGRLWFSR